MPYVTGVGEMSSKAISQVGVSGMGILVRYFWDMLVRTTCKQFS